MFIDTFIYNVISYNKDNIVLIEFKTKINANKKGELKC